MNVRRGLCTKLITTDEEFRGIDIHHIGLIIHFDVSQQLEVCLFRSGRCSRNRSGQAIYLPSTLEELEFCVEMLDGKTHYACCKFAVKMLGNNTYKDIEIKQRHKKTSFLFVIPFCNKGKLL
ncbi:hypothetical protein ABK040_013027 [Willaertia magna]